MKNIVIALVIMALTGCVDYRFGRHWHADETSQWRRVDQPTKFMGETQRSTYLEWSATACDGPILVQTQRSDDGQRLSLFLIPLPFGYSPPNPGKTLLYIEGEPITGRCETAVGLIINGQPMDEAKSKACQVTQDCCRVSIPKQRTLIRSIELRITGAKGRCAYKPLVLRDKRHFCIKATEFGGSGSCDY